MDKKNICVSIPKESFLDLAKMFGELAVRTEKLFPSGSIVATEIMFQIMKRYFTPRADTDKKVNLFFNGSEISSVFEPFLNYLKEFKQ